MSLHKPPCSVLITVAIKWRCPIGRTTTHALKSKANSDVCRIAAILDAAHVTFSSQLTTSSLYKLAIHRAIFCPTLCHQNMTSQRLMSPPLVTTPI